MSEHVRSQKFVGMEDIWKSKEYFDYSDGHIAVLSEISRVRLHMEFHFYFQAILICRRGMTAFRINGQEYTLHGGEILFFNTDIVSSFESYSPDLILDLICFSPDTTSSLLYGTVGLWFLQHKKVLCLTEDKYSQFSSLFALIVSNIKEHGKPLSKDIIATLLRVMLLNLVAYCNDHKRFLKGDDASKRIFYHFISILSDSDVKKQPVSAYARKLGITAKYLSEICKKCGEEPPSVWIDRYTVADILFLLRSTNISVREISRRTGFKTLSHFGTFIHKITGSSPTELREKIRS